MNTSAHPEDMVSGASTNASVFTIRNVMQRLGNALVPLDGRVCTVTSFVRRVNGVKTATQSVTAKIMVYATNLRVTACVFLVIMEASASKPVLQWHTGWIAPIIAPVLVKTRYAVTTRMASAPANQAFMVKIHTTTLAVLFSNFLSHATFYKCGGNIFRS